MTKSLSKPLVIYPTDAQSLLGIVEWCERRRMRQRSVPEQPDRRRPRRRGRPVGSIKLTAEAEAIILSYIEAGAADYIASEAAGIDARTFRDYMLRGLGLHSSRKPTPQLVQFAEAVMQAKARARAVREIQAAEHHVPFWLTHMARSKPGREGWTDPIDAGHDDTLVAPLYEPSLEEAAETLKVLLEAGVLSLDSIQAPRPVPEQEQEAASG